MVALKPLTLFVYLGEKGNGSSHGKCHKVSQPSRLTAETLKKLFPGCSSTSEPSLGKRKFDPSTECIVSGQKKKKKSSNIRGKPRTIPVVLLKWKSRFVPRGYARSRLLECLHA